MTDEKIDWFKMMCLRAGRPGLCQHPMCGCGSGYCKMAWVSLTPVMRAARMTAKWWADRLVKPYPGNDEIFKTVIEYRVAEELGRGIAYVATLKSSDTWRPHVMTECDYDPQGILLEAIRESGVECHGFLCSADGILPRKHSLHVFLDHLRPKEGYGNRCLDIPVSQESST